MYLREKLEVKEYFYPFAEKINPYLYEIISSLPYDSELQRKVTSQKMVRWIRNDKMYIENKKLSIIFICHL